MRTLAQVLLLPDPTRVFAQLFGRYKRYANWAFLLYGVIIAIIGSAEYVKYDEPDGYWPLFFVLTVGTYALLTRSPLAAWRLGTVAILIEGGLSYYYEAPLTAWQWCAYVPVLASVALFYSRGVVITTLVFTELVMLAFRSRETEEVVTYSMIAVLVIAVVGYLFGARGRAEQQIEEQKAEKGALVERARIAREMHDIVAHHMSNVVVRCETAPYRIAGLSDAAKEEFAEVGEAARGAITDMQRLLGVLRADGQTPDTQPQPGINQIPELVRGTGSEAEIDVGDVPEAVGLTAYRLVQEAITNAQRHAPGSAVSVHVHRDGDELEVVVRNTAGGPSLGGGGGRGLTGMRERVAVHGGTLTVKSTDDGGFAVRARIPLGGK